MIVLMLLLVVSATAAHQPLQGTWTLDRASSDDVNKAIDSTIRGMNVITRPIARGRLRKTNPLYERITIAFAGDNVRISAGPGSPVVLPRSGASIRWKRDDGEVFTVSGKLWDGVYTETFGAQDGQRVNAFSIMPDGRLSLQVTVTSPRLPGPLRYRLVYRRV